MARRLIVWALFIDAIPIYPLYALLFVDTGLSDAQISMLFAIWSAVGIVAEVPSGALADRFSRRGSLAVAGLLQGAGFASWVGWPGFPGFACGFVLWGLGGSLISGAQEALLYDGLVAVGAQEHYALVQGRVTAAGLLADLPSAAAATVLFAAGGYPLAGWVSVGICLVASVLAWRLPEPPRHDDPAAVDAGYVVTLRAGIAEAAAQPAVRAALVAAALLGGFDAVEEYLPLIADDAGVSTAVVPLALLPIALAGALGAALGGVANRLRAGSLAAVTAAAMALLAAAAFVRHPAVLAAVAVSYGLYRAVLVVVDARLQDRIEGRSRATVTSVAELGVGAATFAVYAAWAVGEVLPVAVLGLLIAAVLPYLLGPRGGG